MRSAFFVSDSCLSGQRDTSLMVYLPPNHLAAGAHTVPVQRVVETGWYIAPKTKKRIQTDY